MGLFAECQHTRNRGQKDFKADLTILANNRKLSEKRQPNNEALKRTNQEMQKLEATFLSHFQQGKAKSKELQLWKKAQEAAMYEQQNEKKGGIRNVETPKYKQDKRLKAYVEYDKKSDALFYPVGFDSPSEIEAIEQEYARDFGEQEEQEAGDATKLIENESRDQGDLKAKLFKKHYRVYFNDELEANKEIFKKAVFHKFDIIRG